MRPAMVLALAAGWLPGPAGAAGVPMPKVAPGWSVERVAEAPAIAYPTAVVVAPDGTTYLGQDPMDMPGPPTRPIDSVVAIRKDGKVRTYADGLWSVMGLEWSDGTLFVVHAPFLSAFRDLDGDGKADRRIDLVTGLGPKLPGFNGINDHVASGLRLGMDGFLYVAVGDKGIPRGVGRDGSAITMSSGGVIRVRPDGSGLEVVSTGERNPLSVALTASDDVFTFGNDDDSKRWPNSLTHHIVGGHFGYPYEFLTAPDRALPIVDGLMGGAGAQGIAYNEDGLPARYRGNLFFCDWGQQVVHRFQVAPKGGTFRVVARESLVEKGELADFRPFSIAVGADGSTLTLVDWAYNGWLADGPKTGRIFRLNYTGPDRVRPAPRPSGADLAGRVQGLDHPALSARLESQRVIAAKGEPAVAVLTDRLRSGPGVGRIHALWALDAIGSAEARRTIRSALVLDDPAARLQAARSAGIRRDREAMPSLANLLRDPDPAVRREAAIALGRLGDASAGPGLYAALGELDPFAAWSIRHAIRALGAWDASTLAEALGDPGRRDNALKLADGSWAVPVVRALGAALKAGPEPAVRARLVATMAGLYRRYPGWSGRWFGTNPLAGAMPRRTEDWDPAGQGAVLLGLAGAMKDGDPAVRRQAVVGLIEVGPRATPLLRAGLPGEADPTNLILLANALGSLNDLPAAPLLARVLEDSERPIPVRLAAVDALSGLSGPVSLRSRFALAYDPKAPPELIARVLPGLGRGRALPANDLAGFLSHPSELVRAAALTGFPAGRPLPNEVREALAGRLDDPAPEVRRGAIGAVTAHQVREAIPRLVAMAAREPDRAEATRALAAMPDPQAISAYFSALKDRDPSIRRAGESALVVLRDQVGGELEAEARKGRFVGASAMAVERILARFDPLTDWRVVGPFPRTTPALLADSSAIDFGRPLTGAEGRPIAWRARKGDPDSGRVLIDDLKGGAGDLGGFGFDAAGSPDLAAYAYAEFSSDRDRPALMLVGSSGPILVSINDRPVLNLAGAGGRAYSADSDVVRVSLRKGVNRVVVRTRQGVGPWSFGVQVSGSSSVIGGTASAGSEGLRAFALSHPGDPKNGEAIFFDPEGVGCVKCHAAGGRGTASIGPALDGLASKYDKAEVVRSVLEPSSRIANGYRPVAIARRDGSVVAGVVRSETADFIELVDAQGGTTRVAMSEVERREVTDVSTMPAGLVDGLSPVEFADLIAYLMTLKAGG